MTNLDELEALAEAATPGPWIHSHFGTQVLTGDSWNTICVFWEKTGDKFKDHHSASWEDGRSSKSIEANAAYIAAANPARVLSLIAEVRRLREALGHLLDRDERNTCHHDDTHRGGFLWEICDACGAKWADDEGGKPEWKDPPEWIEARALLGRKP